MPWPHAVLANEYVEKNGNPHSMNSGLQGVPALQGLHGKTVNRRTRVEFRNDFSVVEVALTLAREQALAGAGAPILSSGPSSIAASVLESCVCTRRIWASACAARRSRDPASEL